jgi:transglutaminase-like putative cysteine protease
LRSFDLFCATIAAVLAVHAVHVPWWLTLVLALLLAARWRMRHRTDIMPPTWVKLPLVALLLLSVVGYYGTLFGREPGSAFAVGLLVLKTLESDTRRDANVGVAFACFALMAALLFDQGMTLTFVVALGLIPALSTLRSLQPGRRESSVRRDLAPASMLLGAAIPLAVVAFLFVPRLGSPLWGAPTDAKATTGLSASMAPGDLTELLTDNAPAMRVTFDAAVPASDQRYFRAFVMWNFDGRRWDRGFRVRTGQPSFEPGTSRASYEIALEPTHRRILPVLDMPLAAPANTSLSTDRELTADNRIDERLRYRATSALTYRQQDTLDDATRQLGLQLPRGFNPRAVALAAQWREQFGSNNQAIANAALALFHDGGFRYNLAAAPLGRDSVDDFLFQTREGFCEHYSSSFTFLMRAAGIPARVVTGYQGGFFNSVGRYLLVRQSNAHAWSEIWLAGRGWVRYDPTGAVRPDRVNTETTAAVGDSGGWLQSGWIMSMRNRWDLVNQLWANGVNGFDALRQQGLLKPFGIQQADVSMLASVLAGAIALLVTVGLAWALYRRPEGDRASRALQRLEKKLARAGLHRRPSEAEGSFLRRCARALGENRKELETLQALYVGLRYGHSEPPPELLSGFVVGVREFKPSRVVK